ncbi:hypothetical protein EYF80_015411 [Liparis tanakae]|uniref:PDZ domain-containing protein n=1 Tax=Liparis tanakae TaxID=230148 RepID=A0A4Z2I8P5_9TELE|nr:hypothetical protein EYF80_015411 [Liparis tanakae]
MLCCSCLRGEERDPLQQQEEKINGDSLHPHLDQRGSAEREAVQITVEDLGIVNTSFSLLEEDPLTSSNSKARSAGSVSDPMLSESGTGTTPTPGSLLTPPVINLIPPTPSDVVDDDQFFDVNSEESVANTSGSDGSFGAGDQESYEEKMEGAEAKESVEEITPTEEMVGSAEPEEGPRKESGEEREAGTTEEETKPRLLRCAYQVAPLPKYHQNNALSYRDVNCADMLRAELCLLPYADNMDTFTHQRRLIRRSCSLEDTLTRSATFHPLTQTTDHQEEEGSLRQRRVTIASYMPQSKDQNGNFPEKDMDKRQPHTCLGELNTDEVCQWFTSIGLQKCLPFIREVKLCGADIASVDVNTLDILHIATLEEREQLLSAIYKELHPSSTITQRLDSLLGSSEDLPPDQHIGSLLTATSEFRQLELHLCKTVQELHHGLVAFCSEIKNMDGDVDGDRLSSAELKEKLELVQSRLNDKRQSLQTLRDNINNSTVHKKKQLDVRLLEKMKLNCQVFKEEVSMIHLKRQLAHLQNALQESYVKEKDRNKGLAVGSLSRLVSLQAPAMLLVVQENHNPDGQYGFSCRSREGSGLVVVKVDNSHLSVDDRLVEVNGVPVVNSTQEELTDILLQGPSATMVVLRQPPSTPTCQPHPLGLQRIGYPHPVPTINREGGVVTMETPPRRKVMAI